MVASWHCCTVLYVDMTEQRREKLHAERQADPAIMVDIPKTPQAEELQKSGAMDEASELEATTT